MSFQAGEETLSKTTLGRLRPGARVNLERSLALGDRLGGHLVTGHIDGIGVLATREDQADWARLTLEAPFSLLRQMANKGSIAVDGVSLTLVTVTDSTFSVALIPHTLQHTTLGSLAEQEAVNLETDLLAKYVQRQLETRQ
jgi:riboflavin synthase